MIFMSVQVVLLSAAGDGSGIFILLVLISFLASLSTFSLPSYIIVLCFYFFPHAT